LDASWSFVTNAAIAYQDYFDFEVAHVLAPQASAVGGASIDLYPNSGHLAMTAIRSGYLWTCHTIGLSGTNGTYSGNATGGSVDRSGIQWFRLAVDVSSGSLTYSNHGRVYDNVHTTNMLWYYFGSIMANCAGDAVMGFSGSSFTNNLSAFYWFRLAGGAGPAAPGLLRAGLVPCDENRIGDYTATTLDPADDWSFWTIQQYADPSGTNDLGTHSWRTVISRIRPGP
jgi:hypothetical protein